MSDFSDIYGGGAGALLLPGSFGGFRTGWAYPVPPATESHPPNISGMDGSLGSGSRYAEAFPSNTVRLTPFLVPPGVSATTARVWYTLSPDQIESGGGDVPGVGNNIRIALYAVTSGSTLTRVGSDVEISAAGGFGNKTGALVATVSGGATGAIYYIASNRTGSDNLRILHSFRSGVTPTNGDGAISALVLNQPFAAVNGVAGVPYSGSSLPAQGALSTHATRSGWGLEGDRTYGTFPSSLDLYTDLTGLRFRRSVPQFLVGF